MKIKRHLIGSGVLAMAALVNPAPTQGQVDHEDSVRAVRAVLDRQVADWNKGDLDAFLTGYWNSPQGRFSVGRSASCRVERDARAVSPPLSRRGQGDGPARVFRARDRAARPGLDPARGGWRLTMPDGTKPGGLFTLILRRFPEGWKIVHDHTSAEEATPIKALKACQRDSERTPVMRHA